MQKYRKNSQEEFNGNMEQPEVMNMDVMATMTDEDLMSRLHNLEVEREKLLPRGVNVRPWEEEIAYARREVGLRKSRREAHEKYLRDVELEMIQAEADLPVADLDNSHFLRLVGEMN